MIGCVFSNRGARSAIEKQLQDLVDSQPKEDDTPVEKEEPKKDTEETVENPPTGLNDFYPIIGISCVTVLGLVIAGKKFL